MVQTNLLIGGSLVAGEGAEEPVVVYGLEDYTVVRHVMVNFG